MAVSQRIMGAVPGVTEGAKQEMKDIHWIMFLVTAVFSSFMLGYSVPPLLEVGMIGGDGKAGPVSQKDQTEKEVEEYYRKLIEETEK